MVRSARFSWNDEDSFELPDRSTGLDELDDFDFDGFEKRRVKSRESRVESRKGVESQKEAERAS